jgi:hypothetical protein
MAELHFSSKNEDEKSSAAMEAELKQADLDVTTTVLEFDYYNFDEDIIVREVIDLFHRAFQKGCKLEDRRIFKCSGRVDEILHVASSLDMFEEISLGVDGSDLSQHGFFVD